MIKLCSFYVSSVNAFRNKLIFGVVLKHHHEFDPSIRQETLIGSRFYYENHFADLIIVIIYIYIYIYVIFSYSEDASAQYILIGRLLLE